MNLKRQPSKPPIKYWEVLHCGQVVFKSESPALAETYAKTLKGAYKRPVR